MQKEELIKSGIPGFDAMLKGGIKPNSSILVSGGPGTGKTIFALQFAYEGLKNNEPVLFIASEESTDSIFNYAKGLKIPIEKYKDLFTIYEQSPTSSRIISMEEPLNIIKRKKVRRVVLDSLTLLEFIYTNDHERDFRKGVLSFIKKMKEQNVSLLVTSERSTTDLDKFKYKPEDFLFEGLVILTKIRKGSSYERCVTVAKMRGQDHLIEIFPFSIQGKGITIHTKQLPFSLIEKTRD